MKRLPSVLLAVIVVGLLVAADHGGDDRNLKAELSGGEEVPPVVTGTSGQATFHVDKDATEIRFKLKIEDGVDILGAAGAHIHCAPAGENGPVVAFLAAPVQGGRDGKVAVKATISAPNIVNPACGATIADLAASMAAGGTHVNVHSSANTGGELRGQIG